LHLFILETDFHLQKNFSKKTSINFDQKKSGKLKEKSGKGIELPLPILPTECSRSKINPSNRLN